MFLIKKKIEELREKLNKWAIEYYDDDKPSVSDEEYDDAYSDLLNLEIKYPEYITNDSITKRVGSKVNNKFKKRKHEFSMLSLGNAFNNEDLIKFDKHIKDQLHIENEIEYILEYKIDGLSISIIYENGKLKRAITRGDGFVGEDVTHNILTIKDIPYKIEYKNKLEVRGEIYMSNLVFNELNSKGANLANPRNAASGSIRQIDSKVAKDRNLSAFLYSIPNPFDHQLQKHSESLDKINSLGIKVNEYKTIKGINNVISQVEKMVEMRDKINYVVDGIVIKVNNINLWEDIGYTAKFPKYMIAFKFPAEIAETTLEDIFPTVGRTGRITYNGKLSPVRLAGSTVRAATLHNAEYIEQININLGDIVFIKKAGDIIPKVLKVKNKKNKKKWSRWTHCPSCNELLIQYDGEVDQYCINKNCKQIQIAKLEHFVSKLAMNIDGLSIQTIKTFLQNGFITDIASIFELLKYKEQILKLQGFKEKSINKLLGAIEKSKKTNLDRFLFGLGIRHIGSKNAKILAKRFGSLENLYDANIEKIESIRDLGVKASNSIVIYFKDIDNKKSISKMLNLGLQLEEIEKPISDKLTGLTFIITGTLSRPRAHFAKIIESLNGNVASSITSKTDYLLVGENPGSKKEKAQKLNIKIINEKNFDQLMKEKND